jgi:hypothetical protein
VQSPAFKTANPPGEAAPSYPWPNVGGSPTSGSPTVGVSDPNSGVNPGIAVSDGKVAGGFHFDIGLTFASGMLDVRQKVVDVYAANNDPINCFVIPVGLTFDAYYEFPIGLGIGANLGPTTICEGNNDFGGNPPSFIILPVGLDVRYTFFNDQKISPYVRGGFRYPLAIGDPVSFSPQIGAFGAVGLIFHRENHRLVGLEVAYDNSQLDITYNLYNPVTETARPGGLMVTVFAGF